MNASRNEAIAAAIVGELIPQLGYAAPLLLERYRRGEPLVGRTGASDLGFDATAVNSVLLEFFKALVPSIDIVLGWGILGLIETWHVHQRNMQMHAELRGALDKLAATVSRIDGKPVSVATVMESIASAAARAGADEHPDPPA